MAQTPTPSNDPYLLNAQKTYGGMLKLTKIAVIATIVVLVGMALFLV